MISYESILINVGNYITWHYEEVVRIVMALAIGFFLGKERGKNLSPAGARTNAIVCVSSCLVMLLGEHVTALYPNSDPSRLAAQVISGIGFLGAGTILKSGFSVRGLTTAATLWGVACIGLAVGAGFYTGAIATTIGIIFLLRKAGSIGINQDKKSLTLNVSSLDDTLLIANNEIQKIGGQVLSTYVDSTVEALIVKMSIQVDSAHVATLTENLLQHKEITAAYFS